MRRFNPAYGAVKNRRDTGGPKFSIPVPLGLIKFFHDHPINQLGHDSIFDPHSPAFNPVALMNTVFNLPIFYEVKAAPTPTNDVEFSIGRNAFRINLGAASVLIPEQEFGLGSTSRPMGVNFGVAGFKVGVIGFMQYDVGFTLDSALRIVLRDSVPIAPGSTYSVIADGVVQAGFAPTVGYAGRLMKGAEGDDTDDGFYLGAAVHWYMGATYGRARGPAGFTTGTPVFGTVPTAVLEDTLYTSNKPFGQGFGGDVGVVWITGPFEVGVGVNDIGAVLTWKDTKVQRVLYDPLTNDVSTTVLLPNHIESKTKLPLTYIANAALRMGTGTTVGGDIVNTGRGTVIHIGGEQRVGMLALRGGVSRDQRKRMQFGWGGGLRLGPIGLDVGFWTHSNSFATQRAITMATSISVY